METEVKRISDFWLTCSFLEKFKAIGESYLQKIKKEKEDGFEQTKRTISRK